ncbi:MAG: hypothetical protein JSY10_27220 [Paenibacillus sp.]|nr:hypothetical protein [Paenibacillus sp.]
MHFQFVTKYNRDHCHLEDFQPHRRIFGVSFFLRNVLFYKVVVSFLTFYT